MSADNYMHIVKRGEKYVVQHRWASTYYADEGYDEAHPPHDHEGIPQVDWIEPAPSGGKEFDTLAEAEDFAHSEYTEYGVSYGFEVIRRTVEVEA